jgi:hypothetical protein
MAQLRLEAATEAEVHELMDEIKTALVVRDVFVQLGRKGSPPKWLGYAYVEILEPDRPATPVRPVAARVDADRAERAAPVRRTRRSAQ